MVRLTLKPVGLTCWLKYLINLTFYVVWKRVTKKSYSQRIRTLLSKPFDLSNCYFRSEDELMFKCPADLNCPHAVHLNKSEPFLFNLLDEISEDAVIIDVGAHIGGFTLRAARKVVKGLVIALEPDLQAFKYLVDNILQSKLDNVICLPIALWDKDELATLHVSSETGWSTLTDVHADTWIGTAKVVAMKLDTLVKILGIDRVDLIKIDVEGGEVQVLKGGLETLSNYNPIIVVEVYEKNFDIVKKLLTDLHYKINVVFEGVTKEGINLKYLVATPR